MAYMTEPYRNAVIIANILITRITNERELTENLPDLVREWREVENLKREWRGIPRLGVHKLSEVAAYKRDSLKSAGTSHHAPAYIDESAEEPSTPPTPAPTVTTPPTP